MRKAHFLLLPIFHLLFVLAIGHQHLENPALLGMAGILATGCCYAYWKLFSEAESFAVKPTDWLLIPATILGAFVTHYINIDLGYGAVIGAGLVGTIGSFIPMISKKNALLEKAPMAIYCGAFVGMSASFVLEGYADVLIASLSAGIIFVLSTPFFNGFGGKLGTIAFGGVCITALIHFAL